MKLKKRLTQTEEFEILKLVLDKFLWLGFGIMAYGFWILASGTFEEISNGLTFLVAGVVVLVIFVVLLVREYEIVR
jgi:hypothetical protein